jgi:hypothetical protein
MSMEDIKDITTKCYCVHDTNNIFAMHFIPGLCGTLIGFLMISIANIFEEYSVYEELFPGAITQEYENIDLS